MKHGRSPEIDVLLMACTEAVTADAKAQLTHFLNQHTINWDRLHRLAQRHRVVSFLYRALQQIPATPEALLMTLKNEYRASATDNMVKLHHYQQLDALLTASTINHLALKGVYLAQNCYPDSGLRSIGDLDILVRKADALPTVSLLEKNGYRLNQKHERYLRQDARSMLTDLPEISLFKPFFNNSHFDVDLHWNVVCFNKDYRVFDLDEIEADPDLATEWQVVLLVTHHGLANVWQLIYYLNDLYFLLKDKAVNWSWLMNKLAAEGLDTLCLIGLYWCQQIWRLPLPADVEQLVRAKGVHHLAADYEKQWEADESMDEGRLVVKRLTLFSKTQTNTRQQLKIGRTFFSSRVFRATTFRVGERLIYIPKELGFVTIFIRAVRSLARFLPNQS